MLSRNQTGIFASTITTMEPTYYVDYYSPRAQLSQCMAPAKLALGGQQIRQKEDPITTA